MKYLKLLPILFLFAIVISCKDEEEEPVPPSPECDSRLFGTTWESNSGLTPYQILTMNSDGTYTANTGTDGNWVCQANAKIVFSELTGSTVTNQFTFESITFTSDTSWNATASRQVPGTDNSTPLGQVEYDLR